VADREVRAVAAQAWRNVLGGGEYADTDDFFDSGGDSALALLVIAEVAGELDLRVPMTALLEAPTLGEFVACVRTLADRDGAR
jgi:hypothetical protein